MYTFSDFMAICGGLLGLFLGISSLSIVEFIYYTSLRLVCNIRRKRLENSVVSSPERKIIKIIPQQTIRYIQQTHTFLAEICKISNIHGVRYFTERTLHWSERFEQSGKFHLHFRFTFFFVRKKKIISFCRAFNKLDFGG